MIGRFFISKEYYIRKNFENKQLVKIANNMVKYDSLLPIGLQYNNTIKGKRYSKSLFHTRCRFSGRARANFNKFKMSRMIFKKYGENNFLNGVKKASW
jgi:ribosomal protein S14